LAKGTHPSGQPLYKTDIGFTPTDTARHSLYYPTKKEEEIWKVQREEAILSMRRAAIMAPDIDEMRLANYTSFGGMKGPDQQNLLRVYAGEATYEFDFRNGGWKVIAGTGIGTTLASIDELMMGRYSNKYSARSPKDIADLRRDFEMSDRASYLKCLHATASARFSSRFSQAEWATIGRGDLPQGWMVHHMKPLFRGGTNDYTNLRLMSVKFHSDFYQQLHWYKEGQNPYGFN
jgi:hypothetical protein